MSEKSRLLSDPPPKSPILRDFERGLVRKSPRMGGWGASVRIFNTSQTSSKLCVEFRACWYLLEQSPSPVSGSPTSEWFNFVGKPTFVVLVIIISLCHRMDG